MRRHLLAVFALLPAAVMAACTPSSAPTSSRVDVTLTDFAIRTSTNSFRPGVAYTFTIRNEGQVPHEFVLIPPVASSMTDMHGTQTHATALVAVSEHDLAPGATYTLGFTFPEAAAGTPLEMACHIAGHYEAGMRVPITLE